MEKRTISIMVAMDPKGIIGMRGSLPWKKIPSDMKRFRTLTMGHDVIMGRKTFDSLEKPLQGRHNIILSRSDTLRIQSTNCTVAKTMNGALSAIKCSNEVFIIGGAEIYNLFLPSADRMYVTTVHEEYEGDIRFPPWDQTKWARSSTAEVPIPQHEVPTSFVIWERTNVPEL